MWTLIGLGTGAAFVYSVVATVAPGLFPASGKGATHGVLFRDAAAIENLRKVDTLIVDKTGTLTEGKPTFERALSATGYSEDEILRLAASLDQGQRTPACRCDRARGARSQARP